ncbi:hypothetical protein O181_008593 [Austropuccinia psidii MF-1]|uniref:Uncharacterized protein n=1 Tax=Austropuccinia psidii MF-1 TaxID=1389203 RepID=A0A9Q3GIN0_9BASI|nr:hypothetical protein [Austropuccinia psidii MF-1]
MRRISNLIGKSNFRIENSHQNNNYYFQETTYFDEGSRKSTFKNNVHQSESRLLQGVTSIQIRLYKLLNPEASLKEDNNNLEKIQPFPSNVYNIVPRLIMENNDIIKQNLETAKLKISKSERTWSKEVTKETKDE